MKPMTRTAGMLCADDLKLVKAEWDKAKDGPKKDAALVHYTAAEASDKAKKEETCFVHADAAAAALK